MSKQCANGRPKIFRANPPERAFEGLNAARSPRTLAPKPNTAIWGVSMGDRAMNAGAKRRGIWGWMLFDWATQPFHTLVVTFIFAPYVYVHLAETAAEGQAAWAQTTTIASIIIAFLAPILGAIADQSGPRKPWIAAFGVLFVIGCFGLWGAVPNMADPTMILVYFAAAFIGAEMMLVFANAMLPDLGDRAEIGRISGAGWGFGYLGGVVILFIVLLFMSPLPDSDVTMLGITPIFGLDVAQGEPARATGPLSAIWFLIFVLPLFLWTPDTAKRRALGGVVRNGLASLGRTVASLPRHRSLFTYLLASLFYRDALLALYLFGGIYAAGVLGWSAFLLGIFGIIAALTGAAGAWIGGIFDQRKGPKPVIVSAVLLLILVGLVTVSTSRGMIIGIAVDPESNLADIVFMACGAIIGAAGGALWGASRTLLVHQAEGRMPMAEAFGLYALSGKATAFIGPSLIYVATRYFDSQQLGVTPVVGLFVLGLVLLLMVKVERKEG